MKALILLLHVNTLFLHSYYALKCSGHGICVLCDNQSGNCIECIPGLFGPQCDRKCRPNCKGDSCILEAGIDVCKYGCKPGYYGRRCSVPCRRTYLGCVTCDSGCQDGFCLDHRSCFYGCHDSYYGSNCLNCSRFCKECNHVSGVCNECISNYGGSTCSFSCENCMGSCTKEGCHFGCSTGYYGTFCNHVCSSNCLDGCEQGTGKCNDCQDGRYGAICQHRCSKGCTNKSCTLNGRCLHGCNDGYFGPNCASSCEDACIKNKCKGGNRLYCLKVCNTCGQSCRDKHINCSESCLETLLKNVCKDTTTPTTSSIETPEEEEDDYLVIYLAGSVTGLLAIIVTLFIYFSCRFKRIRRLMYGSVRMPTIPVTPPVHQVDQPMPSDAHEYDEVEDSPFTLDLTNSSIAEVFSSGFASACRSSSFPRIVNYSTTAGASAEGEYLTPLADPLQRLACRNTL